ncbi:MAG: UDP-galactopyranose mutase [Deltaproteobacteria bacterium]|nr:UDP-galactopyranose mutase [Deltaproteobacteria bacterium]MBW2140451.1 UDP-galactopyranose mutase [Deltaproteobacteria bacterium]
MFDFMIIGAGFAGCVLAERIANQLDKKVLIVEKRDHAGGNSYDYYNEDGLLVHKYGPHYFRTNNRQVFNYLSEFTKWYYHQYKILAYVDGQFLPLPINLDTINNLYGLSLSSFELEEFFEKVRTPVDDIKTSEDVVIDKVGRDLYEKFFRGYTRKQWGLDPSELDASVCARIPVRTNRDDRYFNDKYQAMPRYGYTKMFEKMTSHPNIHLLLKTDYKEIIDHISFKKMIYTGPIDEFFDHKFGPLPYRSLRFDFETLDQEYFQPVSQVNYPNDCDFTRIVEIKHATGQKHHKTTIVREYPAEKGDPYYPIPREQNRLLYEKYKQEADKLSDVYFIGRLAYYKYLNMDEVVALALELFEKRLNH